MFSMFTGQVRVVEHFWSERWRAGIDPSWNCVARVTQKSEKLGFHKTKNSGRFFIITLADKSGEIHMVFYDEEAML